MTEAEVQQYFNYHNSNMKSLKIGYDEIRSQIKAQYRAGNKNGQLIYGLQENDSLKIKYREKEKALSRILSGIQVSWAEESIKRLLYEKNLLTDNQRTYLLERPALDQRWYKTLKIIFCIAYDLVPSNDENCEQVRINRERQNLGDELVDQYFSLKRIVKDHLIPNFSIRNKVQHGEWNFAFKPKYSKEFSQELTDKINKENIITTTSRYTIVNALYQMLVDMGRFKSDSFALNSITTPFEYFYSKYMRKINFEVNKIRNPDLENFINQIVEKEIRGLQYKMNK
ncbi:hypothetical protein [Winogradskyella marincola]|uniref:Uncharacterized protein n=1 Tax=Winogradskyella marincola TaxID=3037795 RepID=A0ABT6G2B4_9FLAO|nr:hypothetical protein [Winogradskyella sp. YYF002]MDG4716184.1 hypothetical protein [Winogradskyella sp. YYF002]